MAILESCCCWKNLRSGSYACAVYTSFYFGLSAVMLFLYVNEEKEFLFGNAEVPIADSLATVTYNIVFLFCSMLILFASILLLFGLWSNKRHLLLPWIFLMICDLFVELSNMLYTAIRKRSISDPVVGFLFIVHLFMVCLNLYCLLCVISQYQEYRKEKLNQRLKNSPIELLSTPDQLKKTLATIKVVPKPRLLFSNSPTSIFQSVSNFSPILEEVEPHRKLLQRKYQLDGENKSETSTCYFSDSTLEIPKIVFVPCTPD